MVLSGSCYLSFKNETNGFWNQQLFSEQCISYSIMESHGDIKFAVWEYVFKAACRIHEGKADQGAVDSVTWALHVLSPALKCRGGRRGAEGRRWACLGPSSVSDPNRQPPPLVKGHPPGLLASPFIPCLGSIFLELCLCRFSRLLRAETSPSLEYLISTVTSQSPPSRLESEK